MPRRTVMGLTWQASQRASTEGIRSPGSHVPFAFLARRPRVTRAQSGPSAVRCVMVPPVRTLGSGAVAIVITKRCNTKMRLRWMMGEAPEPGDGRWRFGPGREAMVAVWGKPAKVPRCVRRNLMPIGGEDATRGVSFDQCPTIDVREAGMAVRGWRAVAGEVRHALAGRPLVPPHRFLPSSATRASTTTSFAVGLSARSVPSSPCLPTTAHRTCGPPRPAFATRSPTTASLGP